MRQSPLLFVALALAFFGSASCSYPTAESNGGALVITTTQDEYGVDSASRAIQFIWEVEFSNESGEPLHVAACDNGRLAASLLVQRGSGVWELVDAVNCLPNSGRGIRLDSGAAVRTQVDIGFRWPFLPGNGGEDLAVREGSFMLAFRINRGQVFSGDEEDLVPTEWRRSNAFRLSK